MRINTHPTRHLTAVKSERADSLAGLAVVTLGSLMLWIAIAECIKAAHNLM